MKVFPASRTLTQGITAALTGLISTLLIGGAQASLLYFDEDFSGPTLDPAWQVIDNADGTGSGTNPNHFGIIGGAYYLQAPQENLPDDKKGDVALRRDLGDSTGSFVSSVNVQLQPFFDPINTQSDLKFRHFGPDGFVEIVLNSFGDMRVFHNNTVSGVGGNIVPNTNIGITDTDTLQLSVAYSAGTDMLDISYSLNGDASVPFYSGLGNGGSTGDFYTNFADTMLFHWGTSEETATASVLAIDQWTFAVPEPGTFALLAMGAGILLIRRRR